MQMRDYLEILFWRAAIRLIENGYGKATCGEYEPECARCRSGKAVRWIKGHIRLLEL